MHLAALVPNGKAETEKAQALVALGYPTIEPVLPLIVRWLQDLNWPVARVFIPFLVAIGAPLAPHVRSVLATDDDCWKYALLEAVVRQSSQLTTALASDLKRLAENPTAGEQTEGVARAAQDILRSM